jgi:hypothetical protein
MQPINRTSCRRCGRSMQSVAEIAPFGGSTGLIAFVCTACGATDSTLIDPVNRTREVNHEQRQQGGRRILHHA